MIEDLSVLALVTARGGSVGLPGKNLLQVGAEAIISTEWK